MSDESETRQRKPTTSADSKGDDHDSDGEEKEKTGGNPFKNFVSSLEHALRNLTGDKACLAPSRLKQFDIEGVAQFIKNEKPRNIVVMTGAGISTSAGVPDFRSPGTGLYHNLQKYNLPHPQAVFEIGFFDENPEPFFTLAKELFPKDIKPTPSHYFVRLLEKKGMLCRWFTQNIDSLEMLTGIPEEKVVAAHGSHNTSTCRRCHKKYDLDWITKKLCDPSCVVPHCEKPSCDGVVKPDIVFFGENLPVKFFQCAVKDFPQCDLLLIMGTSLVVQPFAGMVHEVADDVPRLLINMEEAGKAGMYERAMGIKGLCYGHKDNNRDVFWKGGCDDGVRKLAELLGWELELDQLIQEGNFLLEQKRKNENFKEKS